jgi:serine/threonine kinase 32
MGQKNSRKDLFKQNKTFKHNQNEKINEEELTRASFEFISIIGKGGFGKVWKVYLKKNAMLFALKEMSKTKIIDKRSEKSVKYEKDLLSTMNHP